MILSRISPLIFDADVLTSAHLAKVPSMPSINNAIAKAAKKVGQQMLQKLNKKGIN